MLIQKQCNLFLSYMVVLGHVFNKSLVKHYIRLDDISKSKANILNSKTNKNTIQCKSMHNSWKEIARKAICDV